MASNQDEDMYLFDAGFSPNPAPFAGQTFDDLLPATPASRTGSTANTAFLDPKNLKVKQSREEAAGLGQASKLRKSSPSVSDDSSHDSSSSSTKRQFRDTSEGATTSSSAHGSSNEGWGSGINGLTMPSTEDMFAGTGMSMDADYEASNQQMADDFDFETAASTPSGFGNAGISKSNSGPNPTSYRPAHTFNPQIMHKNGSPRLPAAQAPFYFGDSRESSPLNAIIPGQTQNVWSKHSPSSGLEETFNGITMNGDSPGNATFSPNMQFPNAGFSFDPDSSATPSTFAKDISSPPSTVNSADGPPQLYVYPTSLKSRVETQIPIKMTLAPLPTGATKLRLPTHTVSKPKFLAKLEAQRSPEIMELSTSLVCTSAMQEPRKLERAFARARGEDVSNLTRPSPTSSLGSHSSRDDDENPLNGGEVRICSGCIQRERKRASRKKQKKPDEEEMFQKDEEKRVVVFNTNEIKEWVEPTRDENGAVSGLPGNMHVTPAGAVQVELPMRIACYCRHQNEKLGFQVIFTIKDHTGKVIAQAMTNSIMITDDHKTHNAPPPVPTTGPSVPNAPLFPGAGVFQTSGLDLPSGPTKSFKQSFSTTDLSGLQHNFSPNFPMTSTSTPFAISSGVSSSTSATLTPRNLSRPASPSGPSGPNTKRRKQSGSGKIPSNLTMTRLETSQTSAGTSTMPNSAATSPFPQQMSVMNTSDRGFALPGARPTQFGTSPPTPSSHETSFLNGINSINRSFSLENLPRQAIISAPSSRQPSRPGSPISNRNSFGAADPTPAQSVSNHMYGQQQRRPPPLIHKLVPAEGSVTGGTEVTLLGNGFFQGLEVMFGDTEATTTTYWGEKCLNCIAPPALQPGKVTVVFKYEHHQYATIHPQSQSRHPIFTYTDDREVEMYRLALKTLGNQMQHPTDDPYSAAQQLLGNHPSSFWSMQGGGYGGAGQHRQANGYASDSVDTLDLETNMMALLQFLDLRGSATLANLEACRPTGLTLLHLAASMGLTRFVVGLLAKGVSPDILDNNGNTPMHHAAMNGHTHIIHRLRLAGADNRIRSIRNYTPADLATSLLAHQAAMIPSHHYHSRSAGGTPMRLQSRNASSSSLRSFWENSSTQYAYSDDSDDSDADELSQQSASLQLPNIIPSPLLNAIRPKPLTVSRRSSNPPSSIAQPTLTVPVAPPQPGEDAVPPPQAFMMAWRDHIAAQINQFQESANWSMPNLPALPDYSRRMSSLFPQRPASRPTTAGSAKEGWWETLTGVSAPPAYNDLYPERITEEEESVKKSSAVQAAADAAADRHFEVAEGSGAAATSRPNSVDSGDAMLATKNMPGKKLRRRDNMPAYIWVSLRSWITLEVKVGDVLTNNPQMPLLTLLLALLVNYILPDVWSSLCRGFGALNSGQHHLTTGGGFVEEVA